MLELVTEDVAKCVTFFATNADVETRKQYVKVLLQILNKPMSNVLKDIHKIASTLLLVSEDQDKSVRENLVARIPEIYVRCHELASPDLEYFLYDRMLEIVLRSLRDTDVDVSCKAYTTTICLLQKYLLDKNRIEQKMCPAIIELSKYTHENPNNTIDYQVNSIELMKLMAPIIGPEKTQELLIGRFLEMCWMDLHYVRKSCAEYFPVFCQVLGTETTESLLIPVFVNLCEDSIWGVRKTAAGSMLKVALMCSIECRRNILAPMMFRLLNDTSRWVGLIAFECLGQFISLFAQPCITGLTYTDHGELYITNAANPDFKHQCNINLIQNYAFYERIFEKSMTPSSTSAGALSQHNINNNNNYYLKTKTGANPLKQFMSPQQYDDVGISTIEKISRRLEMFYSNASGQSNDSPASNTAFAAAAAAAETVQTPADADANFATTSSNEATSKTDQDSNSHAINNNPAISNVTETPAPNQPSTASAGVPPVALNNNPPAPGDIVICESDDDDDRFIGFVLTHPIPEINRHKDTRKTKRKPAEPKPSLAAQQLKRKIKENLRMIESQKKAENSVMTNGEASGALESSTPSNPALLRKNTPADLPMIIKQAIEHKDSSNITSRKNKRQKGNISLNIGLATDAPPETPAIESAPQSIDFEATPNAPSTPAASDEQKQPHEQQSDGELAESTSEPSSKSSDEMSELNNSIEQKLNISDGGADSVVAGDQEPDSDFNRAINAMQYEDAFEDKLSSMLDMDKVDDLDDVDPEFTSANYWYIRPELPLDIVDIFPETLSLEHQYNSITVNDIYNESMHRDKEVVSRNAEENVMDDSWTIQLSKLQRNGGLHENSQYNRPFQQNILPPFLIRYYNSMVRFNDSAMNMHCVYNFPAVVLTLGPQHWHLTHNLLLVLCDDLQWKIRKTVAVFIYQIGLIIGRDLAGQDLVPIFMGFFKDLDEVKIEALRNLTNFLQVIDIQHHHKIIFRLGCCLNTDNYANWRFREELAQQVLNIIQIYGNTYNVDGMIYLTGIAINLLSDEVCSVREIALNAVVATFKVSSSGHITDLISLLTEEFAINTFWRMRQMYIHICHKLVTENVINFALFESAFLDGLLNLANDPVPNIRLNVAKVLSKALIGQEYFSGRPDIANILDKLTTDPDRDVRFMAGPSDNLDDFDPTNANLDFDGEW